MNDKIALITDIHANLEALKSVLLDLKKKKIDTIYSLGDAIGLGYAPSETLDLIIQNNIINLLGNGEAYITMGPDMFKYLKRYNKNRYYNAVWTSEQLNDVQKSFLRNCHPSVMIDYHNLKIALCHFPLDIRYDFSGVWKYNGDNPNEFMKINTNNDLERNNPEVKLNVMIANEEPLFSGKRLIEFDRVIFGHYHFERNHNIAGIAFNCLNATGVAINEKAIYYLLEYINDRVYLNKYEVPYDYNKVYNKLNNIDYPNKELFKKYIGLER